MKENIVLFSYWFYPDESFEQFLLDSGYSKEKLKTAFNEPCELWFDSRVIQYVREHKTPCGKRDILRGQKTWMMRCGYCGFAILGNVDVNKKWTIGYDDTDTPYIKYLRIKTHDWGYTTVASERS